jgi:HEAT repeat protein
MIRPLLPVLTALLGSVTVAAASAQIVESFEQEARSSRPGTRINAIRALVNSRHPQSAELVAGLVNDSDNKVQLEAIDGLLTLYLAPAPTQSQEAPLEIRHGSIAESVFEAGPLAVLPKPVTGDVLSSLESAIGDDDSRVRVSAVFALGVLASPAVAALGPEAGRRLGERLVYAIQNAEASTREAIVRVAARIFDPPAGASGPVVIGDALIAAMNDADARVRTWSVDSLGWLRYERAVQALTDRFEYLRKGDEAAASLHALARIGHGSSARLMQEHASDRRGPFRVMALEGLGRIGDTKAIPTITAALNGTRDETVLLAGAFALHRLGQAKNLDAVITGLGRPSTKRQAQAYLTELGSVIAPLLHLWLRHETPAIRQAVTEVIGLTGDKGSEDALRAATRDSDRAVAEAARQALTRIRALLIGVHVH